MKEKILITGFNGCLAKTLEDTMDKNIYQLNYLTTKKSQCSKNIFYWNINANYIDPNALLNTTHIIHLSGFNISNRWTAKNKKIMFDSRVKGSALLYDQCVQLKIKPKTFISASAMGYYGFNQKGIKDENQPPGNDWMSELCVNWERMADQFESLDTRVCKLRFALILDKKSKIMKKINLSFKFGIGLILGSGNQAFPWIHSHDACSFINHLIQNNDARGVFNVASPRYNSYYEFIKSMQVIKYPRSMLMHIPKIIIDYLMLQKKSLLFNDIKLNVNKMRKTGFNCRYKTLEDLMKEDK